MKLYFGGAFQGKRDYMMRREGIAENEVGVGAGDYDVAAVRAICGYEERIKRECLLGRDPLNAFHEVLAANPEIIIVCGEVGRGVVPVEKKEREFVEAVGRTLTEMAKQASEVYQVFCGIGRKWV